MGEIFFSVERVPRIGEESLGSLTVTQRFAEEEAGLGRGLLIGSCRPDSLIRHVACAIWNSQPCSTVVVTNSYADAEAICDQLLERRVQCWQAVRNRRAGKGKTGASVQIAVPEKLYLLDRKVREAIIAPIILHVVDPPGLMSSVSLIQAGAVLYRGDNIARFKATCEPREIIPYVIVWTRQICPSFLPSRLSRFMGVDAWHYADGRTLRTAAFSEVTAGDALAQPHGAHWLDEEVHAAYVGNAPLFLVPGDRGVDAEREVLSLSEIHGYPSVDVDSILVAGGITRGSTLLPMRKAKAIRNELARAIRSENRRVVVLIKTWLLWKTLGPGHVIKLLARTAGASTLVVPIPHSEHIRRLKKAVAEYWSAEKRKPVLADTRRYPNEEPEDVHAGRRQGPSHGTK